ncbi:MAG: S8 family serine peptidase [Actinomycetes bacterium]
MSIDPGDEPLVPPRDPERNRIVFSPRGNGFAYVDDRVVVGGDDARDEVLRIAESERGLRPEAPTRLTGEEGFGWYLVDGVGDPLTLVDRLSARGAPIQVEHVLLAHGCDGASWASPCGCDESAPFWHGPGGLGANPYKANPYKANGFGSDTALPLRANPYKANRPLESTARPADDPGRRARDRVARTVRVLVLDTGLARVVGQDGRTSSTLPGPLQGAENRVTGDIERPDTLSDDGSGHGDGYLDPVAGHGTFIAGLIDQLTPGCHVEVRTVMDAHGHVTEGLLCRVLAQEAAKGPVGEAGGAAHLVSLSFGGQTMGGAGSGALLDALAALRERGAVVVASAGNDATCVPQYPAAYEDVVAVAALDTCGPASFTNWGSWVDACAPGVDLVSAFFDPFDGKNPAVNGVDTDRFTGWARWSGTSFAAPVVVAALAREVAHGGGTPDDAVERVVRAPHLLRLPCLGTVVNL